MNDQTDRPWLQALSLRLTAGWNTGRRRKLDVVLRQEHRAGEKMFVDRAGPTIPIHDGDYATIAQSAVLSQYGWHAG